MFSQDVKSWDDASTRSAYWGKLATLAQGSQTAEMQLEIYEVFRACLEGKIKIGEGSSMSELVGKLVSCEIVNLCVKVQTIEGGRVGLQDAAHFLREFNEAVTDVLWILGSTNPFLFLLFGGFTRTFVV